MSKTQAKYTDQRESSGIDEQQIQPVTQSSLDHLQYSYIFDRILSYCTNDTLATILRTCSSASDRAARWLYKEIWVDVVDTNGPLSGSDVKDRSTSSRTTRRINTKQRFLEHVKVVNTGFHFATECGHKGSQTVLSNVDVRRIHFSHPRSKHTSPCLTPHLCGLGGAPSTGVDLVFIGLYTAEIMVAAFTSAKRAATFWSTCRSITVVVPTINDFHLNMVHYVRDKRVRSKIVIPALTLTIIHLPHVDGVHVQSREDIILYTMILLLALGRSSNIRLRLIGAEFPSYDQGKQPQGQSMWERMIEPQPINNYLKDHVDLLDLSDYITSQEGMRVLGREYCREIKAGLAAALGS